jgi:hypothetical protein
MKEQFSFKSPESGEESRSEYPINPRARENTLFIERLKGLVDLESISGIPHVLLDAGSEAFRQFEQMLKTDGQKNVLDLLVLLRKPQMIRDEAEQYVAAFFKATSRKQKQALIQNLSALL